MSEPPTSPTADATISPTPPPTAPPPPPPPPPANVSSAPPPIKRANFSISNLLASNEKDERDVPASNGAVGSVAAAAAAVEEEATPNAAAAGAAKGLYSTPFLSASALAHLAQLHGTAGWSDWLGANGAADTHSLWSRSV